MPPRLHRRGDTTIAVDNTDPGIQYTGSWNLSLTASPLVHNGTLAVTDSPNAGFQYSFQGSQVSVYGSVNIIDGSSMTVQFSLDNESAVNFTATGPKNVDGQLLFQSTQNQTQATHLLAVNASSVSADAPFSFDYLSYELLPPPSVNSKHSPFTPAIFAVLGAGFLLVGYCAYRRIRTRRRKRAHRAAAAHVRAADAGEPDSNEEDGQSRHQSAELERLDEERLQAGIEISKLDTTAAILPVLSSEPLKDTRGTPAVESPLPDMVQITETPASVSVAPPSPRIPEQMPHDERLRQSSAPDFNYVTTNPGNPFMAVSSDGTTADTGSRISRRNSQRSFSAAYEITSGEVGNSSELPPYSRAPAAVPSSADARGKPRSVANPDIARQTTTGESSRVPATAGTATVPVQGGSREKPRHVANPEVTSHVVTDAYKEKYNTAHPPDLPTPPSGPQPPPPTRSLPQPPGIPSHAAIPRSSME